MSHIVKITILIGLLGIISIGGASASLGAAAPVGPLPPSPITTIDTQKGQLIAVALPSRSGGRVWRVARRFDSRVVRQVAEADVGTNVVLVFKAVGSGSTQVALGLTPGETAKAYEARRYAVRVH